MWQVSAGQLTDRREDEDGLGVVERPEARDEGQVRLRDVQQWLISPRRVQRRACVSVPARSRPRSRSARRRSRCGRVA